MRNGRLTQPCQSSIGLYDQAEVSSRTALEQHAGVRIFWPGDEQHACERVRKKLKRAPRDGPYLFWGTPSHSMIMAVMISPMAPRPGIGPAAAATWAPVLAIVEKRA